jgi:flavin-dependent dehydrogenase
MSAHAAVENLIIGGGLAGAMLAIKLAQAGRPITLVEKQRGPHDKVCGEFLSVEAVRYLRHAGIWPESLGAVSIRSLRLSSGHKVVKAELPFCALSLSRRILDGAMLTRAEQLGCRVLSGVSVQSLVSHGNAWLANLKQGEPISAENVFLATGKHDLHGFNRGRGRQSDLIGFKVHFRLASATARELENCMELFLFSNGYGGLSLVDAGIANLCLVVRRAAWQKALDWSNLLSGIMNENRRLRQLFEGATPLWPRPLAISPIPYGYIAAASGGLWRLGDQAAVIPSFTGDGMSIALHSAVLAAQNFLAGATADQYLAQLGSQINRSMWIATWLSKAMVTPPGRGLALLALPFFPKSMSWIAASTRIPGPALLAGSPIAVSE